MEQSTQPFDGGRFHQIAPVDQLAYGARRQPAHVLMRISERRHDRLCILVADSIEDGERLIADLIVGIVYGSSRRGIAGAPTRASVSAAVPDTVPSGSPKSPMSATTTASTSSGRAGS